MANQMQQSVCMLVMEYVPGTALFHMQRPFQPERLEQTAADLGRYGPADQVCRVYVNRSVGFMKIYGTCLICDACRASKQQQLQG